MRQDIPNSPNRGTTNFQQIADAFMAQDALPFSDVLTDERIEQAFARHGGLFGQHGVYSTPIVLWAFSEPGPARRQGGGLRVGRGGDHPLLPARGRQTTHARHGRLLSGPSPPSRTGWTRKRMTAFPRPSNCANCVMRSWKRAVGLAESIRNTVVAGVHGRLVESFAVPAAMQAVMMHGRDVSREAAVEILRRMIGGRSALIGQGERDEVQLLRDILSSVVRVPEPGPGGTGTVHVERTVGQILATEVRPNGRPGLETPNSSAVTTVAAMGVKLYCPRGGDQARIFIADDIVRRQLLRDTRWATSRIDQILSRLTGAEREQQRLDGTVRCWGLSLPWGGCLAELGGQDSGQDNGDA